MYRVGSSEHEEWRRRRHSSATEAGYGNALNTPNPLSGARPWNSCASTPLSLVTGLAVAIAGLMLLFGVPGEMGELHEWDRRSLRRRPSDAYRPPLEGLGFLFTSAAPTAVAVIGGLALAVLIVLHMPMFAAVGED